MTTDFFMPNSNSIYLRVDENGSKVEYFHEILRTTEGRLHHNIAVGDICAIRDDDEGVKKAAPFKNEVWIIGQVLALFIKRESIEKTTYHVQVRRLARWNSEGSNFATKETLQRFKKNWFRPNQTLFETMKLETHSLTNVLRADIQLDDAGKFIAKSIRPEYVEETKSHSIKFCCPLRIGDDGLFHDARKEWNNYESRRSTDMTTPPLALLGGWDLLEDQNLVASSKQTWKSRSKAHFYVKKINDGKENKRKATEQQGSLKSSIQSKKRQKRSLNVEFAADSKPHRRTTDSDTLDETMTEYSAPITTGGSVGGTSVVVRMSKSAASTDLNPTPLNKPVFQTNTKSSTIYVEGVEIDVNPDTIYSDGKKNKKRRKQRWTFHVGDTIILRCLDASPPAKPFVSGKSKWYPFRVAVSVVQVVAIYYRNDDEKEMKMQVRWFYRPDELNQGVKDHMTDEQLKEFFTGKDQSRMLVEVDEHIDEVPVDSAVGHAKLTSESHPTEKWLRPDLTKTVPEVGFICRFMHFSKDDDPVLLPVRDWTNYGASSSAPLYRGLNCPKCKPGQSKKLLNRYEERLTQKLGIEKLTESNVWEEQRENVCQVIEWSEKEMDLAEASCSSIDCCYDDKRHQHFTSASIEIAKERCDPRGIAKKSDHQKIKVSIGDFICITNRHANICAKFTRKPKGNPWFPFRGPFIYAQVVGIFREIGKQKSPVMFEVRRFYRRDEVTVPANYLPPDCSRENEEEIFESFDLETISAGRILGGAEVFLGHHTESYGTKSLNKNYKASGISMPKCRCAFFLTKIAVQHLFCADSSSFKWGRRMLERGLGASSLIQKNSALATSIEYRLGICITLGQAEKSNIFQSLIQETKSVPVSAPLFHKDTAEGTKSFFSSVYIEIPWSKFVNESRLCSGRDRCDCWWKVCAGQVVAVRRDGLADDPYYKCNWEPAQVTAITCTETEISSKRRYSFDVRWLRRSGKVFPLVLSESGDDQSSARLVSEDLLGPVYITNVQGVTGIWENSIRYLPTNIMLHEDVEHFDFSIFVLNGLKSLNTYTTDELKLLLNSLDGELPFFFKGETDTEEISSRAVELATSKMPALVKPTAVGHLYTDAKGTFYYKRVTVQPRVEKYVDQVQDGRDRIDGFWTVELGDTVVIEYSHGCGTARFGTSWISLQKLSKHYPAKCAWSVGEVVSIFVEKELDDSEKSGDIELEVRWFYRAPEIKGATEFSSQTPKDTSEEIFESDHYDIVPASALLFPATVHCQPVPVRKPRFYLGMPVLDFALLRFWSPHRKSLLPVESSEHARIQRGRVHSPRFQQDAGLRKSIETISILERTERPGLSENTWRTSFYDVIQKLSLTDASKEGFQSSKAIVGRDKEMKQVLSFLRTALKGSNKEGHRSLFIAGPPGVGKTACVRAAISELEQFRAEGQVPSFEFVCMNGMEMRYPFEAYVQLWEKISGNTVRPEVAASRLEAFFTKEESVATKEAKKNVRSVVVLLDELDYLVTKNQSVLYNFFDWPTHNQSRRLIVLGVSNTLNLVEQLHTRVQSRIGSRRCNFKSYDDKQIENILRAKLSQASPGYSVFDEDAIVFVSKKTASLSGDIRRAFQICRTAAEHVMREHKSGADPLVTIRDAVQVSRESFYSAKSQAITRCTAFEALLLVSLASLSKSTGREFGGFDMEDILVKMEALANGLGDPRYLPTPTLAEAMDIVSRLAEGNIVSAVTPQTTSLTYRASLAGSGGPWPLVSLTVDELSVFLALKKSPHKGLGQKYLGLNGI